MSKAYRILFFEDRQATADEIVACFRAPPKRPDDPKFEIMHYKCAAEALRAIKGAGNTPPPDLALLDRVQKDYTDAGMDICREIVKTWPRVPVVFLSSHGKMEDMTTGIEAGAISYVPKNVLLEANYREFLRALAARAIRSANPPADPAGRGRYWTGSLLVNRDDVEASWRNERLNLLGTDFEMLDDLARPENSTRLRTYKQLHFAASRTAANQVHLGQNVRKRIQFIRRAFSRVDPDFPAAWSEKRHGIVTVTGRGYCWVPDSP